MHEPGGDFAEVEINSDKGQLVVLEPEDAKTIARALILLNNSLVKEYEKIQNTPDVSELIVAAAHKQYNELTAAGSRLHVELAQLFPELTQP